MKLLFPVILFFQTLLMFAADKEDDFIIASLLVAQPGEMLYSCVGHAAFRMQSPIHKLDYCFSYEGEPVKNQILKFVSGELKMGMFVVHTDEFLKQYKMEGRGVREYILNLPLDVKKRMWQQLDEKVLQGTELSYDYVRRGCAISCKDIVESSLYPQYSITYNNWPKHFSKSRGEILLDHMKDYPWNTFFIYSIAGTQAWIDVPKNEKLIIPEELVSVWRVALVCNRYIIDSPPNELVTWKKHKIEQQVFTPLTLSILLLLVIVASVVCGFLWVRYIMYAIQAVIGIILIYIFFVSNLPNSDWTWLLIPFNPIPVISLKYIRYWRFAYSAILIIWLLAMIIYPIKMIDSSYYILCFAILISLNISLISKFSHHEKTKTI